MTECEEVGVTLPKIPASYSFADTERQVRVWLPEESEVVISNVAWVLWLHRNDP